MLLLVEELLTEVWLSGGTKRRLFGDLAYRGGPTARSTLIEGFNPSVSMAQISEMFFPQFLGAFP